MLTDYLSAILNFSVNAYGSVSKCYNVSADFTVDSACDYYANYADDNIVKLHLEKYSETDPVNVSNITTSVVIKRPKKCLSHKPQQPNQSPAIAASTGVTVTVAIVISAIGAILVYLRKKRKMNV